MAYTGVNQSHSWEETQAVVKKYVDLGHEVMVTKQTFSNCEGSREHPYPFEYEVYVQFKEESQ